MDLMAVFGKIEIHKSEPTLERPYKVPFYPVLPIIGIIASVAALLIALTTIDGVGFILFIVWLILGMAYYLAVIRKKDISDFLKHK